MELKEISGKFIPQLKQGVFFPQEDKNLSTGGCMKKLVIIDILDYADIIGKKIEIAYYPRQDNRFSATFSESETKDYETSVCLAETYENGGTPQEALQKYAKKIAGKLLIFNAMSKDRQEFHVPKGLGHDETMRKES